MPWKACDMCEDYVCNVHGGQHVSDCICPKNIETWVDNELDPYGVCRRKDVRAMLERERLVARTH